ncbi:rhox homeobox family member 2 [Rattus norvegicus]|uniref:Reproductive homeobox 9 n=3 Tax=Rattus norvegicus TaxID=10116 RepID=F7EN82_RAT|nr:rhox homeobox family member 2 [Rattus norvegicus]
MDTPQDSCQSFQKSLSLGAEVDPEQQHGGTAVVSEAREVGDQSQRLVGGLVQGGLDQGQPAQGQLAGGNLPQEEPAELSLAQDATGVGEEGDEKEEEMEARYAGDGAYGPEDNNVQQEGDQHPNDQEQPQQEAAIPEGSRGQQAGNNLAHPRYSRTRFTPSQLRDLERLFQETRYPSLRTRKDIARWMGVEECDVQNWFRMRRSLFQRSRRVLLLCTLQPFPQNNSS